MSMNTYPATHEATLVIDGRLAAHIHLAFDRGEGLIPEEIQKILDEGGMTEFSRRAAAGDLPCEYCNTDDVDDIIDDVDGMCSYNEFTGEAETLFPEKTETPLHVSKRDERFVHIVPRKDATLFSTAYESPEELLAEFRETLKDFVPDDVDLWPNVCSLNGTYFC